MSDRDFDQLLTAWMDLGPTAAPDRVADAARLEVRSTRQTAIRMWWPPRRFPTMNGTVRMALAAVAVVVAAVLGYLYVIAPNIGTPTVGLPTTTPSPSSGAATAASFEDQEGLLEAGTYVIRAVEPLEITITVPPRWKRQGLPTTVWSRGSDAHLGFGTVERVYADPCSPGDEMRSVGPSVDDLIHALETTAAFLSITPPAELTVDGRPAKQVEINDPYYPEVCSGESAALWELDPAVDLDGDGIFDPMPMLDNLQLTLVDVEGTRLIVIASHRAGTSAQDLADLQSIFESIRIGAP
jgi:hypothetical protein